MRKNIGYALAAIAGLALVGTACGGDVEPGAVGLARMATSPSESQVGESPDVESPVVEAVDVEAVDVESPSATESSGVTELMDEDLAATALDMGWETMSATERSAMCDGVDMFGATKTGELLADISEGSISATQAASFLEEQCDGITSGGSPGSVGGSSGPVDPEVARLGLDLVWDTLDAAGKAGLCDESDRLGPDEVGAIIADSSGGVVSEADAAAFLIEKCM